MPILFGRLARILSLALVFAAIAAAQVSFTDGVASGEVTPTSAVLWGRAEPQGPATLELAFDPAFAQPVRRETVSASEAADFTLKYLADGLTPATRYYFRWTSGSAASENGTFRTAPAPNSPASVRFTYSGDSDGTQDQDGERRFDFRVLDAVANENPDFFVYLGDTVYQDSALRPAPATSLAEYRQTYRVNRELRPLAALLASTAIYATWDDHEVINDFDGQTVEPGRFETGRQAFFEYMPLDPDAVIKDPACPADPIFRRFRWGSEVDLILLDTRTCRSADAQAACPFFAGIPDLAPTLPGDVRAEFGLPRSPAASCLEAINDPSRTLLGARQKEAFKRALLRSTARFKFVMTPVPIQQFFALPYDRWEGYAAERSEILNFIRDHNITGVVFLAADMHANLVNEVFLDLFADPEPLALEFVTGPIGFQPFAQTVAQLAGPLGVALVNRLFALVQANCRDLDAFSYGLVEVDAAAGVATVSLKDQDGQAIRDQGEADPGQPCKVQISAPVAAPYPGSPEHPRRRRQLLDR